MIQTGDEENWPEIGVHAANWKRKSDLASYMTMVKTCQNAIPCDLAEFACWIWIGASILALETDGQIK